MRYPVTHIFRDRERKLWEVGDVFETDDPKRAQALQDRRFIGQALPEPTEPPTPQEPTDYPILLPGGYYRLPDGSKVRGKKAAEEAMRGDPNDPT